MAFHDERGHRREMTGLLGALGLDLEGTGEVMPHEETLPKDKADRLALLRSTRLNTSPIWGLSLAKGFTAACREALSQAGAPLWRATDDDGVVHEIWPVTDKGHLTELAGLVAGAKVLLADGHHRYQTACTYAAESRAKNGNLSGPYDLVLAFVVELSEDEISIRAIHRLLRGVPPERLTELLAPWYRIEPAPQDLVAMPATSAPGMICLLTRDGYKLLVPAPCARGGGGGRPRLEQAWGGLGQPAGPRAHLRAAVARGRRRRPRRPGRRRLLPPAGAGAQRSRMSPTAAASCRRRPRTSTPSPLPGWPSARSS